MLKSVTTTTTIINPFDMGTEAFPSLRITAHDALSHASVSRVLNLQKSLRPILPRPSGLQLARSHTLTTAVCWLTNKMPSSYRTIIGMLRNNILEASGPGVRTIATMAMMRMAIPRFAR